MLGPAYRFLARVRGRSVLRISLRSLLLFFLAASGGVGVYFSDPPWAPVYRTSLGVSDRVLFSDGEDQIALVAGDSRVQLYDARRFAPTLLLDADPGTARPRGERRPGPLGGYRLTEFAFSPDGSRFLTAGLHGQDLKKNEAKLWDTHTGKLVADLGAPHTHNLKARFSPDGAYVAVGRTWYSPNGARYSDGRPWVLPAEGIELFHADDGRPASKPFPFREPFFSAETPKIVVRSRDGIDWAGDDKHLVLFDPTTSKVSASHALEGAKSTPAEFYVSPRGRWCIARVDSPARFGVWSVADGKHVLDLPIKNLDPPYFAWSLDEDRFAVGSYFDGLLAVDLKGKRFDMTMAGASIPCCGLSGDGKRLCIVYNDRAELWDLERHAKTYEIPGIFQRCAVGSGDALALAGSGDFTVFRRNRPEAWDGLLWLPEFWIAAVLFVAFLASAVADRRSFRAAAASPPD